VRVHPTEFKSYGSRWQGAVAILLLLVILGMSLFRGSGTSADAALQSVAMKDVVVVRNFIATGTPIVRDDLLVESRPVSTLPADVVTTVADFEGRVAAGPIPAGIPLSKTMLSRPEDLVQPESSTGDSETIDPVDLRLNMLRSKRVEVPISFKTRAPEKGTRVALWVQRFNSSPAVVASEAWVASSQGNTSNVLVSPSTALFLEEAKGLGSFSFFVLPHQGESPYDAELVKDINMLRVKLGLQASAELDKERAAALARKRAEREVMLPSSFNSYAWVRGREVRYGLNKEGKIYVIENSGLVTPLYEYNLNLPPQMFLADSLNSVPQGTVEVEAAGGEQAE